MASAKTKQARALVDIGTHKVKAGDLIESDVATIEQLAKEGHADWNRDAVAYAKGSGKQAIRIPPMAASVADAARTAQISDLNQQLHRAQGALQATSSEEDKTLRLTEIDGLRKQIEELGGDQA